MIKAAAILDELKIPYMQEDGHIVVDLDNVNSPNISVDSREKMLEKFNGINLTYTMISKTVFTIRDNGEQAKYRHIIVDKSDFRSNINLVRKVECATVNKIDESDIDWGEIKKVSGMPNPVAYKLNMEDNG